jgi:outer membrane protein TolC
MKSFLFFAVPFVLAPVASAAQPARTAAATPNVLPEAAPQSADAPPPGLASYEQDALAANLTLAEKQLGIERRAVEQEAARAAYYPTIDVGARYTQYLTGGLDLGDLLNPVYGALNQVIGQPRFPTDLELRLPLALDAKVELRQPLYVPAIGAANKLASLGHKASQVEFELARREVLAGVRVAYFGHARAAQVGELLRNTRALLEENLRVSRQLVTSDKQTGDVVFRATAELAAHDQLIRQVAEAARVAARAVNQLRGKPLEDPVEAPAVLAVPAKMPTTLDEQLQKARLARTEVRLLGVGRQVAEAERNLLHTGALPTVALALNYGVQSGDLTPTLDDDYATVSVVASWNVFDGGKDKKLQRAKSLEIAATEVHRRQLLDQIEGEVRNAYGAAEVALTAVSAAQERVRSAQAVYDIVTKKYAAGAVPQIELIAARTALLQAGTDQITAATDYHLRLVELERVTESQGRLP